MEENNTTKRKFTFKVPHLPNDSRRNIILICIFLACIILSVFVGGLVQTAGFGATVEDLRNVTNRGTITLKATDKADAASYTVNGSVSSGLLYVPKNATPQTKAPAVVLTHGLYNNREMQESNAIELVRRGFVVLAIDHGSHGHNTSTTSFDGLTFVNAAKYLYNLDYVDGTRIAVSGHSMGGSSTNTSLGIDGIDTSYTATVNGTKVTYNGQTDESLKAGYHMGIISAAITQSNNVATKIGSNVRGVADVKSSVDEFFYSCTVKEAIYMPVSDLTAKEAKSATFATYYVQDGNGYRKVAEGETYKSGTKYFTYGTRAGSSYYLQSSQAVDFTGRKSADLDKWETINGGIYNKADGSLLAQPTKDATKGKGLVSVERKGAALWTEGKSLRAIYEMVGTHPMVHFSVASTAHIVDFVYNVFGTPENARFIDPVSQSWLVKEIFAAFGFLGLFGLIFPVADLLLGTPLFASLKGQPAEAPELLKKPRKHITYWLSAIATAWYGAWSLRNLNAHEKLYNSTNWSGLFKSSEGYIYSNVDKIAVWGIKCAVFALVVTIIIWIVNRAINTFMYKDDAPNYDEHPFDGLKIRSVGNVLKTPLFVTILLAVFYGIMFFIWEAFVVDFRFWTFDLRVFDMIKLPSMLKYVPFFFIYYFANALFAQNYRVKDLPEWATTIINVVFNVGALIIILWAHNSYFVNNGVSYDSANNLWFIASYPIIPCVAIATVVARRMYLRTGNAWTAGLFNAVVFTFLACANTSFSNLAWVYPIG